MGPTEIELVNFGQSIHLEQCILQQPRRKRQVLMQRTTDRSIPLQDRLCVYVVIVAFIIKDKVVTVCIEKPRWGPSSTAGAGCGRA